MKAKRDAKNQMKTHVQNFTLKKPHWYIFKKHRNFGEIISQARNATFYFCSKSSESCFFKALPVYQNSKTDICKYSVHTTLGQ